MVLITLCYECFDNYFFYYIEAFVTGVTGLPNWVRLRLPVGRLPSCLGSGLVVLPQRHGLRRYVRAPRKVPIGLLEAAFGALKFSSATLLANFLATF